MDLGRVLMSEPKILLLDEPVAGVAGPLAEKIFQKVGNLRDELGISVRTLRNKIRDFRERGIEIPS